MAGYNQCLKYKELYIKWYEVCPGSHIHSLTCFEVSGGFEIKTKRTCWHVMTNWSAKCTLTDQFNRVSGVPLVSH